MNASRNSHIQACPIMSLVMVLVYIFFGIGCAPPLSSSPARTGTPLPATSQDMNSFVKRSGTQLMLDGRPFRFAGANMHWLALDDSTNYPSQFRVDDGLDAAKEMGATVIRSHDLGISTGCANCIEPTLGVFNATALAHDDYVIQAAKERGLRLVIPLTDNWHFPAGGKHNFTDWRGISEENQFYYNDQVISDFEKYISTLLNHVNVYTGVAYKNDPTIMAWETGNELVPPHSWTQTISTYIKSIDSNHLVIDGRGGVDPNADQLTHIDMVSSHYYPMSVAKVTEEADIARREAFYVGEYDWNEADGGDKLQSFLTTIESNSVIAGDTFWELWSHNDQYGYTSNEPQYTLHFPGDTPAMRTAVQELRIHAYRMRQQQVPPYIVPGTPLLSVVVREGSHNVLIWRGTALAASYTVERSTVSANGPWEVICNKCATDLNTPWVDETPPTGPLWYRVIAYNIVGVAGSPTSAYQAGSKGMLIDNLNDWSKIHEHSSNLSFDTTNSQYMQGDTSRVIRTTTTHEYIIWQKANMTSFQAITYYWPNEPVVYLSLFTSFDGNKWILTTPIINSLGGNWQEYVYTLNNLSHVTYVKLVWNNMSDHEWNPDLGEVTIT